MPRFKNFFAIYLVLISLQFILSCVPIAPTGSTSSNPSVPITNDGIYQNKIFADDIQTAQIFRRDEPFLGAVVPISQPSPLWLSFDIIENESTANYDEIFVKLIHCNADWRKSMLSNMDYLQEFNEFRLNDYEFSIDTKVPYTQYRFQIPRVKMPGNYIALVYRNRNENDAILTQRFMVYSNQVAVGANVVRSSGVKERDTHHQLEFVLDYGNYDIVNPDDVKVVLRQNQAWYNAIKGLKPTFVKEVDRILEYRHFTLENNFPAGSEYRFFDIRTTRALGQNIGDIELNKTPTEAFLLKDKSRLGQAYSQYEDLNGGFAIGNKDNGIAQSNLEADYVLTHFFLKSAEPVNGDVYITGDFNNRMFTSDNQMKYDAQLKGYLASLSLKQGFYNYQYYVQSNTAPSYFFEGSHFETENQYEILIYHRPVGARADLLIGYSSVFHNSAGN